MKHAERIQLGKHPCQAIVKEGGKKLKCHEVWKVARKVKGKRQVFCYKGHRQVTKKAKELHR